MPSNVIIISYLNASGMTVNPYSVLEFEGNCDVASTTGVLSFKGYQPSAQGGPYGIDTGQGTTTSGAGAYGQLMIPLSHPTWAIWSDRVAPPTPWITEVGPMAGSFGMWSSGSGYYYAGQYDSTNNRILVVQKTGSGGGAEVVSFKITEATCHSGTGTGTGTGTGSGPETCTVMAEIINVWCGGKTSLIGDVVQLHDDDGCWFIGDPSALVNLTGTAVLMNPTANTGTGTGTGTGSSCYWKVITLPCVGSGC